MFQLDDFHCSIFKLSISFFSPISSVKLIFQPISLAMVYFSSKNSLCSLSRSYTSLLKYCIILLKLSVFLMWVIFLLKPKYFENCIVKLWIFLTSCRSSVTILWWLKWGCASFLLSGFGRPGVISIDSGFRLLWLLQGGDGSWSSSLGPPWHHASQGRGCSLLFTYGNGGGAAVWPCYHWVGLKFWVYTRLLLTFCSNLERMKVCVLHFSLLEMLI